MGSRSLLLSSLTIMLLFCTKSIASNGYFLNDGISKIIADAESAAEQTNSSPWIFIGTSTYEKNYYLNNNSIVRRNVEKENFRFKNMLSDSDRPYRSAWWKVVDTNGNYIQIQTRFYCDEGVTTNIASAEYDANNNYLGTGHIDLNRKLEPIIPDTVFFKVSKAVCNVY